GDSREIATRPAQAGNKSSSDWVESAQENDWNSRGRRPCCSDPGSTNRGNYGHLMKNQIGCHRLQSIILARRMAKFDDHVAALDETHFAEALAERARCDRIGRFASGKKSDHRHRRLLGTGRDGPFNCRPAQNCNELTPSHSMTSSASARSIGGMSRFSVFAVFRLITSSYLVGSSTGRSPAFAPFRIRPT